MSTAKRAAWFHLAFNLTINITVKNVELTKSEFSYDAFVLIAYLFLTHSTKQERPQNMWYIRQSWAVAESDDVGYGSGAIGEERVYCNLNGTNIHLELECKKTSEFSKFHL